MLRPSAPPRDAGGSTAVTVYLVVGLVGLLVLAVSLLLGDALDGLLDGAVDALGDAFSTAVLGAFLAALGFGGAIAEALDAPLLVSLPVGVVSGVVFGWFASWLTRLVRDGGSDATLTTDDTRGRDGRVVTGIPADGFGVVDVLVGGHTMRLNARAEEPLDPGTPVHVTSVLSPTAVTVAPLWPEVR